MKDLRIGVLPIGDVPKIATEHVAKEIKGHLSIDTDVLSPLDHPDFALDPKRLQYNAGAILQALEEDPLHDYTKVIAILNVDLFIPIFTHVFGEAKQGGDYALVSLYRLREKRGKITLSAPMILDRTAKVALHELGHLFDLVHCLDNGCLMHFSGTLRDLDDTPLSFCHYCATFLRDVLGRLRGPRRR